jgi:hypothetical protein
MSESKEITVKAESLKKTSSPFIEMVQNHERQWGQTDYTGRPSLQKLLESPVVVFWRTSKDTPLVVTVHESLDEVGKQLARQIILGDKYDRALYKVFVDHKPMRIASVNVEFAEDVSSS